MSGLGKAFEGIKQARESASQLADKLESPKASKPALGIVGKPARSGIAPNLAKSSDTNFRQVNVYLRKATVKAAGRKWEDADGGDFSDLVEKLLAEYLAS